MKTRHVASILLICASTVGAQERAHSISFAKQLDAEVTQAESAVLGVAEAMPEDRYNFSPKDGAFGDVRTFADQLRHIAANNCAFWGAAAGTSCKEKIQTSAGPLNIRTKAELLAFLEESFAMGHKAALGITAENASDDLTIEDGGDAPRLYLITSALSHTYDHYGQIVIYLRMNGIIPPASRK